MIYDMSSYLIYNKSSENSIPDPICCECRVYGRHMHGGEPRERDCCADKREKAGQSQGNHVAAVLTSSFGSSLRARGGAEYGR